MIKLHFVDEVLVKFEGLKGTDITYIIESTKMYVKGCFTQTAFKIGAWDGKESHFREDGFTFLYMLDKIIPLLEDLGYSGDDLEIVDHRQPTITPPSPITDNLLEAFGITLRYYQVDAVNTVIKNERGIIEAGTNAGKTLICLGLSYVYDKAANLPSIIIVPSNILNDQTYETYKKTDIDVCQITEKDSIKKIEDKVKNHKHVIIGWQKLKSPKVRSLFTGFRGVVLYDECHIFGDAICGLLTDELSEAPIRVGMTGTLPKDKQKNEKIFCHIGGGPIYEKTATELIEENFASDTKIHMVQTIHSEFHKQIDYSKWTWNHELKYTQTNKIRIDYIIDFIRYLHTDNTLILCQPEMGKRLADALGLPFVDKDMPTKERDELYRSFDDADDVTVIASYGTTAVGVSTNRIFRLIMIDVGKDSIKTFQSIGRSIRKDGVRDSVDIIDLYADSKYAVKHRQERVKLYREYGYKFQNASNNIIIK
jgi:superfamily II DNA or RNA helicase